MTASLFAFSELKGLAGMACMTKKVIATTRKMVSNAIRSLLIVYVRNFAFMRTSCFVSCSFARAFQRHFMRRLKKDIPYYTGII